MADPDIRNFVLLGAGRLGSQLGRALNGAGIRAVQIYNRSPEKGRKLADELSASYTDELHRIDQAADLYIVAVSDHAIPGLLAGLHLSDRLIVHTSGFTGMDVMAIATARYGVLYPVQTFSPASPIDFRSVPVCLEANNPEDLQRLEVLAGRISGHVCAIDSERRRRLHLAAVFACNFTNFMYVIAEELLRGHDLPASLLIPLIRQTALVPESGAFFERQTGPALRQDITVLEGHRAMLAGHPDFLSIYENLSRNIIKFKTEHGKL